MLLGMRRTPPAPFGRKNGVKRPSFIETAAWGHHHLGGFPAVAPVVIGPLLQKVEMDVQKLNTQVQKHLHGNKNESDLGRSRGCPYVFIL